MHMQIQRKIYKYPYNRILSTQFQNLHEIYATLFTISRPVQPTPWYTCCCSVARGECVCCSVFLSSLKFRSRLHKMLLKNSSSCSCLFYIPFHYRKGQEGIRGQW